MAKKKEEGRGLLGHRLSVAVPILFRKYQTLLVAPTAKEG
jgi:hypothetical protein